MDTHISFLVQINHDFFHMWNFKMHFFPMLISLIILKKCVQLPISECVLCGDDPSTGVAYLIKQHD